MMGFRRAVLAAAAALPLAASDLDAQRGTIGIGYAMTEYAEQGSSLRFGGGGVSAQGSVAWRRLSLHVSAEKLALEPKVEEAGTEAFDVLHADIALRASVSRLVSVEAGFLHRGVKPSLAAQSIGALRLGAVIDMPLATGADLEARASYVGASRFSGGGSAPFGVGVGLAASYAPRWERVRLTADLDFLRLDRRTDTAAGEVASPVQSTTARIGIVVAY